MSPASVVIVTLRIKFSSKYTLTVLIFWKIKTFSHSIKHHTETIHFEQYKGKTAYSDFGRYRNATYFRKLSRPGTSGMMRWSCWDCFLLARTVLSGPTNTGLLMMIFLIFYFFFWFGFYGPFKNISLISSRSFIKGGRKPENPEKNHLTIRKQNLAFPHVTRARLEPQW